MNGLLSDSDRSEWYNGNIHFANESVTSGEIRYCLDHDLVVLKKEEQMDTSGMEDLIAIPGYHNTIQGP